MRYRSSIETNYSILCTIADKREFAQYDLPREVGKDYRTILRHLKQLENHFLIRLARTEPAEKGGKDRKIYTLTLDGLVAVLKFTPLIEDRQELVKGLDEMACLYSDFLPLIFGKWDFWTKHDVKDLIIERFIQALKELPNPLNLLVISSFEGKKVDSETFLIESLGEQAGRKLFGTMRTAQKQIETSMEKLLENVIGRKVLYDVSWEDTKQFLAFLTVLAKDPDLTEFTNIYLADKEKEYQAYLTNVRSWKEMWLSLTPRCSERV